MHVNPNPAKLFVGNLPFKATRDEVMQFFSQAGTVVDATILVDKFTGRSRGFGFVEMSSGDEAMHAKEMLNGKDFQGRNLIVNDARPEQPRDQMGAMPSEPMAQDGMQQEVPQVPSQEAPSDNPPTQ